MPRVGEGATGDSPMFSFRVPQELHPFLEPLAREQGTTVSQLARQAILGITPPKAVSQFASKKQWPFRRSTFLAQPKLQRSALFHECLRDGRINAKGEPLTKPELVSMNVLEVPGGIYFAAYCDQCERLYWMISTETPPELLRLVDEHGWVPVKFQYLPPDYFPPHSKGRPGITPKRVKGGDGILRTEYPYLPYKDTPSKNGEFYRASWDPDDRSVLWTKIQEGGAK